MHALLCLLQFAEDRLLLFRQVVHQPDQAGLHTCGSTLLRLPFHRLDEVVCAGDQPRFAGLDEGVAPLGRSVMNTPRKSEQSTVVGFRLQRGGQTAAVGMTLHYDYRIRQSRYDPVALDEIGGIWFDAQLVFRHHSAVLHRRFRFRPVLRRIDPVQTMRQHHDCRNAILYGRTVCRDIYAVRPAGDDDKIIETLVQLAHKRLGQFLAPLGRTPRAYDRHHMLALQGDIPPYVQRIRLVRA